MTEDNDNLIEDDSAAAKAALETSYEELMDDEDVTSADAGESDFDDSDDEESEGELNPNDIFGLDPLDVLTLEELAEYLKVSPAAARRVIKEQNLPGKNIGGEWRFLRDAVANWLRGQEAPAQQQQKARTEFAKATPPVEDAGPREQYSRPPRRPFQADQQAPPTEYRPRQRFPEGGGQYGGQQGGQYGGGGGQYGGAQGGQYGGGGGQYGGGGGQAGSYSRPPRRQFGAGAGEGGNQGGYGSRDNGGGAGGGGYQGGGQGGYQGGQFGGGGYGGAAKRKNKRQVFDNERGKRLDRRKDGDVAE